MKACSSNHPEIWYYTSQRNCPCCVLLKKKTILKEKLKDEVADIRCQLQRIANSFYRVNKAGGK